MSIAAGTTLAKLNEIVIKNENSHPLHNPTSVHAHRYEQNTREELSRALDEKDAHIRKQETAIHGLETQLQSLRHRNEELSDRV